MTWILWERTAFDLARATMGFGVNCVAIDILIFDGTLLG